MANEANIRAVVTASDQASGVIKKFGENVSATNDRVSASLKDTSGAASEAESSIGRLTKAFVFGNVLYSVGANVAVKFKDGLKDIVTQANEAAKVQQQLNSVIESTGGVAGVSAKAANELADSIRNNTTIDNDAVLQAENMLLTFRAIGSDIFPQTTRAVVDMATAMNGGATPSADQLRQAALRVGKALQDPTIGLTALRRSGVEFSAQQQQQVKDFLAVNNQAGAQKIILDELSKEFGGSAAKTAETFSGKLQQIKNRMDDFGKSVVLNIEGYLNKNLPNMERFAISIGDVATRVANFLQPSLDALWNNIATKLMPALTNFWKNVIEPLAPVIGTVLVGAVWGFVNALNAVITIIAPVMGWLAQHKDLVYVVAGAYIALRAAMMLGAAFDAIRIGVVTLETITFPSMIASIQAVSAAWVTAFPIAGILVDIGLVATAIRGTIQTFELLKSLHAQEAGEKAADQQAIGQIKALTLSSDAATRQRAFSSLHTLGVPGYAEGGIVPATPGGQIIRVAEAGYPEAIVPLKPGMKGGVGTTINIHLNAGAFMGTDVEARKFAQVIVGHIRDIANSKNMPVGKLLGI